MKLLLLVWSFVWINAISLADVRVAFDQTINSEKQSQVFINDFQYNPELAVQGYVAAVQMMMAKYKFNPYTKLATFRAGQSQLEKLIQQNSNHVELRFIRYMIQQNAPSFLGYNGQLKSDKNYLEQQLPSLSDTDLKKRIQHFLKSPSK